MAKVGLSTEVVIDAAARMLDEQAGDGLNLASLAGRLGVRPPSLYKHVDGMSGLRRGIALRAKADFARQLGPAAVGKARDDAVRSLARAYRSWAKVHPGQYPLAMRTPTPGDDEDEAVSATLVDVLYTIVSGYGIDGSDLVDATRFLRSAIHGFVDLETTGAFGLPHDVEHSFDRVIDSITTALTNWAQS